MNSRLQKYLNYTAAYWQEIQRNVEGELKEHIVPLLPEFYRRSGNLLVFPAKDGVVSVGLESGFRSGDEQFDSWLVQHNHFSPHASLVTCSHSYIFNVGQWVQVFSGNSIRIKKRDGSVPEAITVRGFPLFPGVMIQDPATNRSEITTLMVLEADSGQGIGLSLRNVSIEEVDTGRLMKPFWWMQLDVYTNAALERLDPKDARLDASREILALIAAKNLGLPKQAISSNPVIPVMARLEEIAAEFMQLLDANPPEGSLQSFLQRYPILLGADFVRCIPHPKLGAEFVPDFIFLRPASSGIECVLVEIEPSELSFFTKNGDVTAPVNHAIGQIRDWRAWLRQNASYAQSSLQLPNLHSECRAIVVVGRGNTMTPEEKKRLEALNVERHWATEILTYDDLHTRLRTLIESLRKAAQ